MTEVIDPPASRRERKKSEVRQRLYEAAVALFRSRGFDETQVEAITDLADTSKGTFFNYFPTKEHVLAAYHDEMTGALLGRMEQIAARGAEQAVQAAMQACADWVQDDPEMGRIVVTRIFGHPILHSADLKNTGRFMEWFRARLERGIASGELRPNLDIGVMLSMLAAVLSSTMNAWVLDAEPFDLRATLKRKTRFLFDAARRGERKGNPG